MDNVLMLVMNPVAQNPFRSQNWNSKEIALSIAMTDKIISSKQSS